METTLSKLQLKDEETNGEGDRLEFDPEEELVEERTDFCLVGCFPIATMINFQSMKTVLTNLWHPLGESPLLILVKNDFCFNFTVRLT